MSAFHRPSNVGSQSGAHRRVRGIGPLGSKGENYLPGIQSPVVTSIVEPTSDEELREALETLVQNAYQNGVLTDDSSYSLVYEDSDIPDWDVLMTRVERRA